MFVFPPWLPNALFGFGALIALIVIAFWVVPFFERDRGIWPILVWTGVVLTLSFILFYCLISTALQAFS